MIRPATHQDHDAIARLIRESHARSKYADRVGIAPRALEGVITGMLAQQNQMGPQGSHVAVAERSGRIVGFIAGVFDRVYHVGDKLTANDLYFVVGEGGTVGDTLALVDSYVAWASKPRACIEIMLSWSDTIPGAEKIAALARRKGFEKCGEMFEMRLDAEGVRDAA